MAESIFTQKEREYLNSQRLARIATASVATEREGSVQPDVAPVGFDFDGEYFYVGGMNLLNSTKYRNVMKNNKVAIVVDDFCFDAYREKKSSSSRNTLVLPHAQS